MVFFEYVTKACHQISLLRLSKVKLLFLLKSSENQRSSDNFRGEQKFIISLKFAQSYEAKFGEDP